MNRSITNLIIALLGLLLASQLAAVERVAVQDPESERVVTAYRSATGQIQIGESVYRIDGDSRIYNDAGQVVRVMPGDRAVVVSVVQQDNSLPLIRELLVRKTP
jgi:hypothetical protein